MNSFVNFPIDLSRTATALEGIHSSLSRLADAVERLSPPPPYSHTDPQIATISDLRRPDPVNRERMTAELDLFARNNNVVLNSEAFIRAIIGYEKSVADAYGQEAILELPWNKAAGGRVFEGISQGHADLARAEGTAPQEGDKGKAD